MALSETWLHNHKEGKIHVEGYSLFRSDRARKKAKRGRCSGGVALYAREDLASTMTQVLTFSNGVNEALGVYSKKEGILIVTLYRQPDDSRNGHASASPEFEEMLTEIKNTIKKIPGKQPDIFICGDFNLPHVSWEEDILLTSATNEEKKMYDALKEFMNEYFLNQIVHTSTHKDGNTLDLLLTNNKSLIHSYHSTPTLRTVSHHNMIEFATTYRSSFRTESVNEVPPDSTLNQYNYYDENIKWDEINEEIIKNCI